MNPGDSNGNSLDQEPVIDLLARRFVFPDLGGQRVLIVGLGGGSDIISAYALAQMLRRFSSSAPAETVYANTKRHADKVLELLAPQVYRVPATVRKPVAREPAHGTTLIDQAVDRGDRGCPWILRLAREEAGQRQLTTSLQRLAEWDLVIAVDTGADSIVPTAESGAAGRDKTMLRILGDLGTPLLHAVVGPGCDGETSFADLRDALGNLGRTGQWLGCFALDAMLPAYREFAPCLDPSRTPNILLAAFDNTLRPGPDGGLVVPRGMCPVIPRSWLTTAFVFRPDGGSLAKLSQ